MNKKYLIPLLTTLFLAGCNGGTNPQGTTSTPNNPTTPTQGNYASWTEEEKAIMIDAIGTILPEGPFSNERQSEGYIDEYDGAYTFYMFDGSCGDVSTQYASILENAGYSSLGVDNSYGYDVYTFGAYASLDSEDIICVQFGYYPGDDEYEPGIDLYAWIYSEDSSDNGGNNDPVIGETTSWTEDEKAIMMDAIGMILPEGPFSNERESEGYIDEYDGAYTFYMFDGACGDVSAQYASILENAGWIDDGTDDSYGYLIYYFYLPVDGSDTDFIYIQLDYYPGDDEYEPGIDLYAWIYSSDSSEGGDWMYTSWPEADINDLFTGLTTIPAVPGTGFDLYDYEGQIIVMAETNSDIENTYCDILEDAGWTVDLSNYDEYGIIATSAANDIELCFYYDSYSEWFIMSIAAI